MEQDNWIVFTDEEGNEFSFAILEETSLQGKVYLLVTENPDAEELECDVMERVEEQGDSDMCTYQFVENDDELENIFKVFETLLSEEDMEG